LFVIVAVAALAAHGRRLPVSSFAGFDSHWAVTERACEAAPGAGAQFEVRLPG
jgi:hypothetical protein